MPLQRIPRLLAVLLTVSASTACASEATRQERFAQKLQERFTNADANGDGRLTAEEADGNMPRVFQHFSEIDSAGRGSVTLDEIRAYLASQAASRRAAPR